MTSCGAQCWLDLAWGYLGTLTNVATLRKNCKKTTGRASAVHARALARRPEKQRQKSKDFAAHEKCALYTRSGKNTLAQPEPAWKLFLERRIQDRFPRTLLYYFFLLLLFLAVFWASVLADAFLDPCRLEHKGWESVQASLEVLRQVVRLGVGEPRAAGAKQEGARTPKNGISMSKNHLPLLPPKHFRRGARANHLSTLPRPS